MSQFDIKKFLVENKITTNSKIIKEGSSPHDYDKEIRKHDSTKYRRQEDKKEIERGSRLSNPFHILDAVHKFNEEYMKDKVEFTDQIGDSIGARATIQWDPTSTFGNEDEVEEVHYEMMDYIKNDPHLGPAFSVLDSVGGKAVFWVTATMDEGKLNPNEKKKLNDFKQELDESVLPDVIKEDQVNEEISVDKSYVDSSRIGPENMFFTKEEVGNRYNEAKSQGKLLFVTAEVNQLYKEYMINELDINNDTFYAINNEGDMEEINLNNIGFLEIH